MSEPILKVVIYNFLQHQAFAAKVTHNAWDDVIGRDIVYIETIPHNKDENCTWCNAIRTRILSRTPLYDK